MKHIFTELSGVSLERQQDACDCVLWRETCSHHSFFRLSFFSCRQFSCLCLLAAIL